MLEYLGIDLLNDVHEAYADRLQRALDRGYAEPGSKYHWLYEELDYRIRTLRQVSLFLNALTAFMSGNNGDKPMFFVVSYTTDLFTEERIGEAAYNHEGSERFFDSSNAYWQEMQEVLALMGKDYDFANLPMYYVDLCEYTVRSVRLHLYIRECAFHAIDRDKFDVLMRRQTYPAAATEGGAA